MEYAAVIEIWFDQPSEEDAAAYLLGVKIALGDRPDIRLVETTAPEPIE